MKLWWKIWWTALAAKLLLTAWLPLSPDEAYYLVWAKHLQLSYFDHPPMVAWLMWLGAKITPFALRWPAVIVGHVGLIFWSKTFAKWLSKEQQVWWLSLALLMPLVGPGSLIVTPDLPLLATWGLSLFATQRFIAQPNWSRAILLGIALGLTGLSKYHAALLPPIILFWWCENRKFREILQWIIPVTITALLVLLPVIVWNYQHDWISFKFQIAHGLGRPWKPSWTSDYFLAQIGLLFPIILWAAWSSRREKTLLFAAVFPLIFFALTSFRGYVEANWPIPSHPVVLAMAVLSLPRFSKLLKFTGGLWAALIGLILVLLAMPQWPNQLKKTKLFELREYEQLALASQNYSPLYARSYQMASWLSYRRSEPIYKLRGMNRRDFYDSLEQSQPTGSSFYLIIRTNDQVPSEYKLWVSEKMMTLEPDFEIWRLVQP